MPSSSGEGPIDNGAPEADTDRPKADTRLVLDTDAIVRVKKIVKAVKAHKRYRGTLQTTDILNALIVKWLDSKAKAIDEKIRIDAYVTASVRNFIVDQFRKLRRRGRRVEEDCAEEVVTERDHGAEREEHMRDFFFEAEQILDRVQRARWARWEAPQIERLRAGEIAAQVERVVVDRCFGSPRVRQVHATHSGIALWLHRQGRAAEIVAAIGVKDARTATARLNAGEVYLKVLWDLEQRSEP